MMTDQLRDGEPRREGLDHDTLDGPAAERPATPPVGDDPSAGALREEIVGVLRDVYDPEIPVNIYELGLVYDVEVDGGAVVVTMTLTTPNCPEAVSLPGYVEAKVGSLPGVRSAKVEIVWDPPWSPERMSEAARLQLGMF